MNCKFCQKGVMEEGLCVDHSNEKFMDFRDLKYSKERLMEILEELEEDTLDWEFFGDLVYYHMLKINKLEKKVKIYKN